MTDATPTAEFRVNTVIDEWTLGPDWKDEANLINLTTIMLREMRAHAAQAVAEERERCLRAADWLDYVVRGLLPSEHVNCGIDSGCSHAKDETLAFERLDEYVAALRAGQPGQEPQR